MTIITYDNRQNCLNQAIVELNEAFDSSSYLVKTAQAKRQVSISAGYIRNQIHTLQFKTNKI